MVYRSIGVVANNFSEGFDIVLIEFQENAGEWTHDMKASGHFDYTEEMNKRLELAPLFNAVDYQFLHTDFGSLIANHVNKFILDNKLQYQVSLVAYLGVSVFYQPGRMISQLGHGAAIAALTKLPVVTDLPAMDVVNGGNGRFFQVISEKLKLPLKDGKAGGIERATCVALMGVLRWREEYNFLSSITGAKRDSIGGCVWLG